MFNLLRMDLRRASKGKATYVILFVLAVSILISIGTIKAVTSPDITEKISDAGVEITQMDQAEIGQFLEMKETQALYSTIFQGGFFSVMIYIIAVLMICMDFRCGFAKNIFALNSKRYGYALSKWLTLQALSLVGIVMCLILFRVSYTVASLEYMHDSVIELLKFVASIWIIQGAFNAQAIALCLWIRNEGAGIAAAIVLPGGLIALILESFLGLFHISIMKYTIYGCMDSLSFPINLGGAGRALLTAVIWTVIWMAAAAAAVEKKDI